jgi:hypothetical protein
MAHVDAIDTAVGRCTERPNIADQATARRLVIEWTAQLEAPRRGRNARLINSDADKQHLPG